MGKWYYLSGVNDEVKPLRVNQVKKTDQDDVVLYQKIRYPMVHQTARHRVYCTIVGDVSDLNELHLNDNAFLVRTPALVYVEKSEDIPPLEHFFQHGTFDITEGNESEESGDPGGDTTREQSRRDDDSQTMEEEMVEMADIDEDEATESLDNEDDDYMDED